MKATPFFALCAVLLLPVLTGCGAGGSGPPGATGAQGAQGIQGPQGPQGAPGITYLNVYNPTTAYVATDAVSYLGSSYIAIASSTGIPPAGNPNSTADWSLLAAAGAPGATGSIGPQGPIGPQGLTGATGTPGAAGPQGVMGSVGPQGLPGATGAIGPQGIAGPQGPAGLQGATGITFLNAYAPGTQYLSSNAVTFQGSTYLAIASSLNVPPAGDPASGSDWSLLAQAGATGPAGANGVDGAAGPEGPSGPAGPSGPQGPIGPTGPPGQAAPVNVGTTSTDAALLNVTFGANNATPVGDADTVVGVNAGQNLTTASEMTIFGADACQSFTATSVPTTAPEDGLSTCIGSQAGKAMTLGSIDNVFMGQKAGLGGTVFRSETILGVHAGASLSQGTSDVIVGAHTMDTGGPANVSLDNTILGANSADGNGAKTETTLIGWDVSHGLQTATNITVIGAQAGNALTTGQASVLIGDHAGNLGTTLQNSVIIGTSAAPLAPPDTTAVGYYAGLNLTAAQTSLFGYGAGDYLTSGIHNTCLGFYACGKLSTGAGNTTVGYNAGGQLTGAEGGNIAIGSYATTAAGVDNAVQLGTGTNSVSGSLQINAVQVVDGNGDLHAGTVAPASNSPCTAGAVRVVMPYVYACVATNQWMRSTLSSY
jgi:hypothetical protein